MESKSTKDIIIKHILSEYNPAKNGSGNVIVSKNDAQLLNLSEFEVVRNLILLQEDNLIRIIKKSPHNDLSMPCIINVQSDCLEYFNIQKRSKTQDKREWVRTYMPNILSTIAIIVSIIALIVSIQALYTTESHTEVTELQEQQFDNE